MQDICWLNVIEGVIGGFFSFLITGVLLYILYDFFTKGKIKIPTKFDISHNKRHRIKIVNKGRRTLQGLTSYITFINLERSDLDENGIYFISPQNYIPIERELIIFDNGNTSIDLNPKQEIDVDLLHFENNKIIIPSEKCYTNQESNDTKSRVGIKNIEKTYQIYLEFFALNYNSVFILFAICARVFKRVPKSKRYCFEIKLNEDKTDVAVRKL